MTIELCAKASIEALDSKIYSFQVRIDQLHTKPMTPKTVSDLADTRMALGFAILRKSRLLGLV